MREIEELAYGGSIGSSEVEAITPEVISKTLLDIAHKKTVWEQLYKDNRDLLGKPGKQVTFPKKKTKLGAFKVGVPEKTDITQQAATVGFKGYGATTIGVTKIGGYMDITREAIKFSMRDVVQDEIYETGLQFKEAIDDMAYNQLMFGNYTGGTEETVSIAANDTGPVSLGENVVKINSLSWDGAEITGIDYCEGSLYLSDSIGTAESVYLVRATQPGLCVSGAREGESTTGVSAWGVLQGKAAMIAEGRDPEVVVMSYSDVPNLIYDDKVPFLDAASYPRAEEAFNGEIGQLWGMRVVTENRKLPEGVAVIADTDRMGYDVHKEELQTYREEVYKKDAVSYYFYAERGFGIMDTLALAKVVGGTSTYPSTNPVA